MADSIAKQASNEVIDRILVKHGLDVKPERWAKKDGPAMRDAFLDMASVVFGAEEQPIKYMKNYVNLSDKSREMRFPLMDLLGQDKGASDRVLPEVVRRVTGVNTLSEKRLLQHATPVNKNGIDPVITIFQRNFTTVKWWGSLGTFNIRFEPISCDSGDHIVVRLEGADIYRWHEDRKGLSEKVHLLGLKLKDFGLADEFPMRAEPCTVRVSRKLKQVLFVSKQSNPNNSAEIGQSLAMNVARKYPDIAAKYFLKAIVGR